MKHKRFQHLKYLTNFYDFHLYSPVSQVSQGVFQTES